MKSCGHLSLFRHFLLLLVIVSCFSVASCATVPPKTDTLAYEMYQKNNDPIEPFNRKIFAFNLFLDHHVLRPLTWVYIQLTSPTVRRGAINFIQNLGEGVVLANDTLQGRWQLARDSFFRITINTFLGLFGVLDLAKKVGYTHHDNDFGYTLKTYNLDSDMYIVLPIIGPSTGGTVIGRAVDGLFLPTSYVGIYKGWKWGLGVSVGYSLAQAITLRAAFYDIIQQQEMTSIDFYLSTRSFYRQNRQNAFNKLNHSSAAPAQNVSQLP